MKLLFFLTLCGLSAAEPLSRIQFTDVTAQTGITFVHTDGSSGRHYIVETVSAGLATFDYNQDGKIDILVGSYVDFSFEKHKSRNINGHPAYSGPMTYGPVPSTLFRNNGDGTFTDISRESGIASKPGTAMGVICADYDDDGDTDIIVG